MNILGISAFYHDSAASLIIDGKIIAAAEEERFSRVKHDSKFPLEAIKFCLEFGNIDLKDIDYFVFYDKPFLKFERLLETYIAMAPMGLRSFIMSAPIWLKEKMFLKSNIIKNLESIDSSVRLEGKILFNEHHKSHAASAFFPSPFDKALILTMDGVGEWATTTVAIGDKNKITIKKEINFPHSIGLLYSAFTYHCGFKVNSGEYKLMGLAPYGSDKYVDKILNNLIKVKDDGSFRLNMKYFDYCTGLKMTNRHFTKLFGIGPRIPESEMLQEYMDLAASVQKIIEEIVQKIIISIVEEYKIDKVCLAGGVALNSVSNGKILDKGLVKELWIQPASGDAGGAIGAALSVYYEFLENERKSSSVDEMQGALLGPEFSNIKIKKMLTENEASYIEILNIDELLDKTAELIVQGKCIGWFQGRMEFGPRSLGNRAILADPRSPDMQKKLNLKIKKRESFRPFAPSVMSEKSSEWFNLKTMSPYMLLVHDVKKTEIPAVTHINNSARVQTVAKDTNPLFHSLLSKFYEKTNCPILVNTSFNVRGEPIVCTPFDAYKCFMATDLDALVVGSYLLLKVEQ